MAPMPGCGQALLADSSAPEAARLEVASSLANAEDRRTAVPFGAPCTSTAIGVAALLLGSLGAVLLIDHANAAATLGLGRAALQQPVRASATTTSRPPVDLKACFTSELLRKMWQHGNVRLCASLWNTKVLERRARKHVVECEDQLDCGDLVEGTDKMGCCKAGLAHLRSRVEDDIS